MSNYKYAIIVPNYNNDHGDYKGKTFLVNCIESILNQTYKNFKLIIVDDMSDDTSVKTIKKYKKQDNRVVLIQNYRKRYNGGSRNVGIEYALQKLDIQYFCFLDSDDWWKYDDVLELIDKNLDNHELMTLGCEMLKESGFIYRTNNKPNEYLDLWSTTNKVWCTAWDKVIRRDKIKFFCEDTLMEDRVWSYKIADDINWDKVTNLARIVYVWNQMNKSSVSKSNSDIWKASVYCHIGHEYQFLSTIKHKEMIPIIEERIKENIKSLKEGKYEQH